MSLHGNGGSSRRPLAVMAAVLVTVVALCLLILLLMSGPATSPGPSAGPSAGHDSSTSGPPPQASGHPGDAKAAQDGPAGTPAQSPSSQPPVSGQDVAAHPSYGSNQGKAKKTGKPTGDVDMNNPNPLGKKGINPDALSGTLTETQKGRVTLAASQFVLYAYGFTGQGQKALVTYQQGVSRAVVAPVFYDSPAASVVSALARQIKDKGNKATASLNTFDVQAYHGDTVEGIAHFVVTTPKSSGSYSQSMTVRKQGAVWRLSAAGTIHKEKSK